MDKDEKQISNGQQCRINGINYSSECLSEKYKKAIELAMSFREFCIEQHISNDTLIYGVSWDANYIQKTAYNKGKELEQKRIASLLGIKRCY